MNKLQTKSSIQRSGVHWDQVSQLLLEGENYEEAMGFIVDCTIDELEDGFIDESGGIVEILIDYVLDWMSFRYIKLRSTDSYPCDYSFICEISVEEAKLFQAQIDGEDVFDSEHYDNFDDYMRGIQEVYSYGEAYYTLSNNIYEYKIDRDNFIYVETAILGCCLDLLNERGWFVTWEDKVLTSPPFETVW